MEFSGSLVNKGFTIAVSGKGVGICNISFRGSVLIGRNIPVVKDYSREAPVRLFSQGNC